MVKKSALHDAIKSRDIDAIKQILQSGNAELEAEFEIEGRLHLRPIHYAVKYSGAETELVIGWLAEAGADLNAKSRDGSRSAPDDHHVTALYDTAGCNHIVAALALLNGRADPNVTCFGWTPLHHAAEQNHPMMIELLASRIRVNINAKHPENGMTPMHSAAYSGAVRACSRLWLLGADITAKNSYGETPLELAAAYKKQSTVAFLSQLANTSNANEKTPQEWGNELLKAIKAEKNRSDMPDCTHAC